MAMGENDVLCFHYYPGNVVSSTKDEEVMYTTQGIMYTVVFQHKQIVHRALLQINCKEKRKPRTLSNRSSLALVLLSIIYKNKEI